MSDRELRLPPSVTTGRLEGLSVPDLLWTLCRGSHTGELVITSGGVEKHVFISDGRIVFASSTDANDRLGERLLREGEIRLDHLEEAVRRLPEGKRLGTILVEAGHLPPDRLVRGVVAQVKGIVLDLFDLEEGEYRFVEGPLPTDEVITLNMRTGEILLEGIRRVRSLHRIRRSVGSPRTRYRRSASGGGAVEGLALSDGERYLLERLEGEGADVEDLCREVFLSNFEIYQALWAFKVLGVIEEIDRPVASRDGAVLEGRLQSEGFGALLVRVARSGETGILRVARGTHERSFHVRDGRCVFATSNSFDDGLISHLLRRGIISLHDREEVARRVLSNKRVGTILLEMGVISEADLRALVREQLCEIVRDTFRWGDADWVFIGGPLPTLEEITLDLSLEDLVAAGARHVTSWTAVTRGLGGLETRLVLTPEYLAVLDRMTSVGSEDWEVLSALAEPQTALELCRRSPGGDFRTCQTLWALRLLGAVAEAPPVDARAEDPAPIAPAQVSADSGFEVTGADDMTPPTSDVPRDGAIAPSTWVAPTEEVPSGPSAWAAEDDEPALTVAPPDPEPAEVISEPWRLAAELPPEGLHHPLSEGDLDLLAESLESPAADEAEEPPALETLGPPLPEFELEEPSADLPMRPTEEEVPEADEPLQETVLAEVEEVDPPQPEPTVSGLDADPDRTLALSREEIDAALFGAKPGEPAPQAADDAEREPVATPTVVEESPWEPPPEVEGDIARFNARHKLLFRTIRAEVGAGAQNFVRSCRNALHDGYGAMFDGVTLQPDGTFDVPALRAEIVARRVAAPATGFQQLLDQEISMLRVHVGDKRIRSLVEEMEKL